MGLRGAAFCSCNSEKRKEMSVRLWTCLVRLIVKGIFAEPFWRNHSRAREEPYLIGP
jgi:hypothetical protein